MWCWGIPQDDIVGESKGYRRFIQIDSIFRRHSIFIPEKALASLLAQDCEPSTTRKMILRRMSSKNVCWLCCCVTGNPETRSRLRLTGNSSPAVGFASPAVIVGTFAMPQSVPSYAFAIELPKPLSFLLHIAHIGKISNIFAAVCIYIHFVTSRVTPLEYLLRIIRFKNLHDV